MEQLRIPILSTVSIAAALLAPHLGLTGVWLAMCGELCFLRGLLFLTRLLRGKWLDQKVRI